MNITLLFTKGSLFNILGGAEKVLSMMANELCKRGHYVQVICCEKNNGVPLFSIDKKVQLINLNGTGKKLCPRTPGKAILRELFRPVGQTYIGFRLRQWCETSREQQIGAMLKRKLESFSPDLVIAYFPCDLFYLINAGLEHHIPLIQMFHGNPRDYYPVITPEVRRAFIQCDAAQVLVPGYASSVERFFSGKVVVLPNIAEPCLSPARHEQKEQYRIINVARLDRTQKRQDILLEAFALLADEFKQWTVHIFGDVSQTRYKKKLQNIIQKRALTNRVFLEGPSREIPKELGRSDLFAFPSAYEGFSLALIDAMAAGLPCVGFRSAPSVNEMIIDGMNGCLTDDGIENFACGLKQLMSNVEQRRLLGHNAMEYARMYTADTVWNSWEKLINQVVCQKGK